MLNRNYATLTVNGPVDLSAKNIYAGSPLTLGPNGYKKATASDIFAGLSMNNYNPYLNDVLGGEWFNNSKMVNVVKIDQVVIDKDSFPAQGFTNATVSFTLSGTTSASGTAVVTIDGVDGATVSIESGKTAAEAASALASGAPAGYVAAVSGATITFTKQEASAIEDTEATANKITLTGATDLTAGNAVVVQFVPAGSAEDVFPYDSTRTYSINDELFVDSNGLITNDSSVKNVEGTNYVGRICVPPTSASTIMVININVR